MLRAPRSAHDPQRTIAIRMNSLGSIIGSYRTSER